MTVQNIAAAARDDTLTIVALAAMAICTTAMAHEALGHGTACLAAGGHITLLTNAFFRCSAPGRWIAIAGPLGNLAAGLIAFAAQSFVPLKRPGLRFYALCVMAFCLYWEAGYILFAMIKNHGDYVFAYQDLAGPVNWTVRAAGMALGIAGYFVIARMLSFRARVFSDVPGRATRLLRTAWLTAVPAMGLAAALFAPDRFGAVHDAALSAAAAFPLLFPFTRLVPEAEAAAPIARNMAVVALGAIVFALFAATMGRGIY